MEVLVQSRSCVAAGRCQVQRQLTVSSQCRPIKAASGRMGLSSVHKQARASRYMGFTPEGFPQRTRQLRTLQVFGVVPQRKTQSSRRDQHMPRLRARSQHSSDTNNARHAPLLSVSETSSSAVCTSDGSLAQPYFPLAFPKQALAASLSSLQSSAEAAAKVLLWFVMGKYIPARLRVLVSLLRAERYYRKHIRTIDTQQLLHELNFLPEFPSLETLCPALAYFFVLFQAVFSTVQGLASIELLQGSAAVPGLPEVEFPTVGTSAMYEFPDKSDQPETPGYKPLGEWVGPRGMKPWERNAVTISEEDRKKLWEKQMRIATLQPYNSTPRERKALVALAFISTALTQIWILLHVLLVPLVFIAVMVTIEKPLFWVLAQLYKIRKYIGWQEGTIPLAPPP